MAEPPGPAGAAPGGRSPAGGGAATLSAADVHAAAARLRGHVLETPCLPSRTLGELVGCEVYLKFENLQFTASFKERGALSKLSRLNERERACGVLAVSAGNHAQGVAYHARRLGIPATIVMPRYAPAVKIDNTRRFGAEIVLEGETFDEARAHGLRLAVERGLTLVHPYDDLDVAAGQGTIGLEMLAQQPAIDTLVVAVGGGGLISGIAVAARSVDPAVRIVGVQSERFPAVWNALHGGTLDCGRATIADGIGVRSPGALTLPIIRREVDEVLLVEEGDIELAILALLEIEKTVVEGAGAVGLAALMRHRERFAGRRVGLVLCGGNIEPLVLAEIIERGMARSGRLVRLAVDVRDVPGALAGVAALLGGLEANIEQVRHQRTFTTLSVERVRLEVVLHTRGEAHVDRIVEALVAAGHHAERMGW